LSESSRPREHPRPKAAPARPTISFSFNLGKIAGQGEDADPILRDGRDLGLVAVFDGMGGAGGTVYETPDGPRSGAYLASRLARDVVEQRMLELLEPEWNLDGRSAAEDLRGSVERALAARLSELNAPPSALRSKLLRALPTTMALGALQRLEPAGPVWSCHVLWAGDSRVYVFEPEHGAHQLTTDDVRDRGDAMANLREDSVVSNAMSADTDFVVHHRQVELTAPFLLVAATDGCFGYVRSPMHFERLLLRTLLASDDTRAWSDALQREITAVTGDDAAMALLGVGADHDGFRALFEARAGEVEKEITAPIDELGAEVARVERQLDELRRRQADVAADTWARYKPAYEQYLDDAAEDQHS
jgi:serine/threonine protein phosphatase PrpC